MQITCEQCGIVFENKTAHRKFCTTCRNKRKSLQVMESRKRKNPEIEIGVGSGKAKNNLPGPTNQSWVSGIQAYRKLVPKIECAYCGSNRFLVIHHIDENRYNNTPENLRVLCKSCHQKHHTKRCSKTGKYLAK